jgi:mannose-6-phosphate isomerase-like protein (cupin superfamily)
MSTPPYILKAGEGVSGFGPEVKASIASTGGQFTLIESHTKGGAPWHVHTNEDEYFYVVDGTIIVYCGEQEFEAGPRSFVFLPKGIPHAWDVKGPEKATLLMMTVPGMLEGFLQEFHAASTKEGKDQVSAKYGISFVAPPVRKQ